MWVEAMLNHRAADPGSFGAGPLAAGSDTIGRVGLWSAGLLVGVYLVRLALAWILLGVARLGRPGNRSAWGYRLASTAVRLAPQRSRARVLRWSGVALTTGVVLGAGTATMAVAADLPWPSLDRGVVPVTSAPVIRNLVERAPAGRPSVGSRHENRHSMSESRIRHSVVVRRGDTLWDIAARHLHGRRTNARIARAWPQWYRLNRRVIGADPNLILPGMRLRIPTSSNQVT